MYLLSLPQSVARHLSHHILILLGRRYTAKVARAVLADLALGNRDFDIRLLVSQNAPAALLARVIGRQ